MPTLEYSDEELGLSPGWDNELDPNIRRELRQARITRKELESAQQKLTTLERERTLARAGIPSDKRGELFARTYEGPVDDPAAVKAAYDEIFGATPAPTGDTGTPTGDQRIADAGAAGTSEGSPGVVDLADAIRAAKTPEEIKAIIRSAPPEAGIRLPED